MSRLARGQLIVALFLRAGCAQTAIEPKEAAAVLARMPRLSSRQTLSCKVTAIAPFLNLGMRLQSGYFFRIPANPSGRKLTVLTTVTPESGVPAYLLDRLESPPGSEGYYENNGSLYLGEGRYRVRWLVFDETGDTCRTSWTIDAELGRNDRRGKLGIPPNTVMDVALTGRPAVAAPGRRLTILLDAAPMTGSYADPNFDVSGVSPAPARTGDTRAVGDPTAKPVPIPPVPTAPDHLNEAMLRVGDRMLLLGALSAVLEQLPASEVRLVVFSLDYQKELFRRDGFTLQSVAEAGRSFERLEASGVDYHVLLNRTGHLDLLARLINRELRAEPQSEIVVFLGPRERFRDPLPDGVLDARRGPAPRFFFLAYEHPTGSAAVAYSGRNTAAVGGDDISDSVQTIARSGGAVMSLPPQGSPDTLSRAIGKLKGKTLTFGSASELRKAIQTIQRQSVR
jgi:hypothetical protein